MPLRFLFFPIHFSEFLTLHLVEDLCGLWGLGQEGFVSLQTNVMLSRGTAIPH